MGLWWADDFSIPGFDIIGINVVLMFNMKDNLLGRELFAGIFSLVFLLFFGPNASAHVYADTPTTMLGYWKLDETSSGSCKDSGDSCDSSGNGNNGSWVGSPTPVNNKPALLFDTNGSLQFNGSSSYVNYGNISAANFGTSNFSVSFWIYPTDWGNGSSQGIIDKKASDLTNGWTIYNDTGQESKIDARLGQQNQFFSNSNVPENEWSNWVLERSGTNIYWYFDGTLDATGTNSVSLTDSASLEIGHSQTWNGFFQGDIANVRIFPYALSQADITNLANGEDVGVNQPGTSQQTINVNGNGSVSFDVLTVVSSYADPSTLSIISNPSHGAATDSGGSITYTPNAGYSGSDSLEYRICSIVDNGICSTGALDFAVLADPAATVKAPNTGFGEPVADPKSSLLVLGSGSLGFMALAMGVRRRLQATNK